MAEIHLGPATIDIIVQSQISATLEKDAASIAKYQTDLEKTGRVIRDSYDKPLQNLAVTLDAIKLRQDAGTASFEESDLAGRKALHTYDQEVAAIERKMGAMQAEAIQTDSLRQTEEQSAAAFVAQYQAMIAAIELREETEIAAQNKSAQLAAMANVAAEEATQAAATREYDRIAASVEAEERKQQAAIRTADLRGEAARDQARIELECEQQKMEAARSAEQFKQEKALETAELRRDAIQRQGQLDDVASYQKEVAAQNKAWEAVQQAEDLKRQAIYDTAHRTMELEQQSAAAAKASEQQKLVAVQQAEQRKREEILGTSMLRMDANEREAYSMQEHVEASHRGFANYFLGIFFMIRVIKNAAQEVGAILEYTRAQGDLASAEIQENMSGILKAQLEVQRAQSDMLKQIPLLGPAFASAYDVTPQLKENLKYVEALEAGMKRTVAETTKWKEELRLAAALRTGGKEGEAAERAKMEAEKHAKTVKEAQADAEKADLEVRNAQAALANSKAAWARDKATIRMPSATEVARTATGPFTGDYRTDQEKAYDDAAARLNAARAMAVDEHKKYEAAKTAATHLQDSKREALDKEALDRNAKNYAKVADYIAEGTDKYEKHIAEINKTADAVLKLVDAHSSEADAIRKVRDAKIAEVNDQKAKESPEYKAQEQAAKEAERIHERNRTAWEKDIEAQQKATALYQAGLLSLQDYQRERARIEAEYEKSEAKVGGKSTGGPEFAPALERGTTGAYSAWLGRSGGDDAARQTAANTATANGHLGAIRRALSHHPRHVGIN